MLTAKLSLRVVSHPFSASDAQLLREALPADMGAFISPIEATIPIGHARVLTMLIEMVRAFRRSYRGFNPKSEEVIIATKAPAPDQGCVTPPDGSCVGTGCMHDPVTFAAHVEDMSKPKWVIPEGHAVVHTCPVCGPECRC